MKLAFSGQGVDRRCYGLGCGRNGAHPLRASGSSGFTLVELLVASAVFLLLLGALGAMLVGLTRAYGVVEERSRVLQDSESAIQLLRYEVSLAGYRGLGDGAATRSFTLGSPETVVVEHGSAEPGDRLTVRYFEDPRFLPVGDSGERSVEFFVTEGGALARCERNPTRPECQITELLVGGVAALRVVDVVAPNRDRITIESIVTWVDDDDGEPDPRPSRIDGLNVRLVFSNEAISDFMIGLANPQVYEILNGDTDDE